MLHVQARYHRRGRPGHRCPGPCGRQGQEGRQEAANAGPIPYSQLAEADAKLNGPAPKAHHAKKKVSKDAAQAGSADAAKTAK